MRTQVAIAYVSDASTEASERFLADVDERVDDLRRHDGSFDQTFVRLHVLCRNPRS